MDKTPEVMTARKDGLHTGLLPRRGESARGIGRVRHPDLMVLTRRNGPVD